MRATFTPEQEALASTAEDLAADGLTAARTLLDGGEPPAEPTASLFGGFAGLAVPEELGGDGGGLVDLAVLVERLGRRVTPTAFVPHTLAVQAALGAGLPRGELTDVLTPTVDGGSRWTLAVGEGTERGWGPWSVAPADDGLRGTKSAVPHGADADLAVVALADGRVTLAPARSAAPRVLADRSRPAADLTFAGPARLTGGDATAGLRRAAAALAAELAGVGRGAVDLAVGHAREREQFGGPVGRFQGVAHQLADALTAVESAWSLALYACWAVEAAAPDAVGAVHTAKARASDAAVFAAERAVQAHGGIGITWEADPHLYLRRAAADAAWLGTAAWHRQRVAEATLGA